MAERRGGGSGRKRRRRRRRRGGKERRGGGAENPRLFVLLAVDAEQGHAIVVGYRVDLGRGRRVTVPLSPGLALTSALEVVRRKRVATRVIDVVEGRGAAHKVLAHLRQRALALLQHALAVAVLKC